MVIDHIGIAVKSLKDGLEHWEKVFGYVQSTTIVENTRQKVRVVFLTKPNSITVKLIEPTESASVVSDFVRKGGGLHHLCFRCDDMGKEMERMKAMGLRVLAEPQPGEAFENEEIAFIYAKQGLNIELIDTEKKAGRLS
jgi:methylmalonyl-CoA/ethylmalonyl-CoA epimerase